MLHFLARGATVRGIAAAMSLDPKTIARNQTAIRRKLGVRTPAQLLKLWKELTRPGEHELL